MPRSRYVCRSLGSYPGKLQPSILVMSFHSSPTSVRVSNASALPTHPPPGMGFAQPSTPFPYACPAMGTTSSSQQSGAQQDRTTIDELREERSPTPRVVIKGPGQSAKGYRWQRSAQVLGRKQLLHSGFRWQEWQDRDTVGGPRSHLVCRIVPQQS